MRVKFFFRHESIALERGLNATVVDVKYGILDSTTMDRRFTP